MATLADGVSQCSLPRGKVGPRGSEWLMKGLCYKKTGELGEKTRRSRMHPKNARSRDRGEGEI